MRNGDFFKQAPTTSQTQDWLVQELFRTNRSALVAGYPSEGKSMIELFLLYSIAYNAPFADIFAVTSGNVMFLDSENEWHVLKERCTKIIKGLEIDGFSKSAEIDFQHMSGFRLDDNSTWQPIFKEIDTLKPVIISIDHLAKFHSQDENREDSMKKVLNGINELKNRQGSFVYINHHFNKSDMNGPFSKRLRGTSALLADSDTAFEVRTVSTKQVSNDVHLEKVGLIFQPRKDIMPVPIRLKIEEGKDWLKLHYDGEYQSIEDPWLDDLCHRIYHYIFLEDNDILTTKEVLNRIQGYAADYHVRDALAYLRDKRGLLTSDRKGRGGGFNWELNIPSGAFSLVCPWCKESVLI